MHWDVHSFQFPEWSPQRRFGHGDLYHGPSVPQAGSPAAIWALFIFYLTRGRMQLSICSLISQADRRDGNPQSTQKCFCHLVSRC